MTILATLVLVAALFNLCHGAVLKHNLTVSEQGALYNQEIDIDEENRVVYIHVPAHRDLPENKFMYEFTTGRLLRCTPSVQLCYLSNFDTQSVPDAGQEEHNLIEFARKRTSPQEEEASETVSLRKMVVTEKIEETEFLTMRMREVLENHTLYWEEKLPKGAKILKGGLGHYNKRVKRLIHFIPPYITYGVARCRYGLPQVWKYGYSDKACNHIVLCTDVNNQATCKYDHHGRINYHRCLCCPEVEKAEWCIKCFEIELLGVTFG